MVIDANLLVYAYDESSPHHARARNWLDETLSGIEPIRIALVSLLAFVRITTNPSLFLRPLKPDVAIGIVESWLAIPSVGIADPGERHWRNYAEVTRSGQVRGPHLMDAHLAALAIEHGATLMTADRGFARFPGVKLKNPIAR
jgi:Predicted nucleic acid-binding protein, contains PIN domain